MERDSSPLRIGWPPPARSITLSRAWARPTCLSTCVPSPSGPRCRIRAIIRSRRAGSTDSPPRFRMPAMPHMTPPSPSGLGGRAGRRRDPARKSPPAGRGSLQEEGPAEQPDDEDAAEDPETESKVGAHGEAVSVVDHPEDPPAVRSLHQLLQVDAVELEPDA